MCIRDRRQSEALFQHVKRLPEIVERLNALHLPSPLSAVGASTRPREVEGSYMPCFLAGESQARVLATTMAIPFYPCSHQQGHIAAAAWSAGRMDLLLSLIHIFRRILPGWRLPSVPPLLGCPTGNAVPSHRPK